MQRETIRLFPIENYSQESGLDDEYKVSVLEKHISPFTGSRLLFGFMEDGREVVVKYSVYPEGPRREWEGLQRVSAANVPAQNPISLAKDSKNKLVLVTERVLGEILMKVPGDEKRNELGKIVRLMHESVQIDGNEWANRIQDEKYHQKYFEFWEQLGISEISPTSIASLQLRDLLDVVSSHFPQIFPSFIHNDLHEDQVIYSSMNGNKLIDFEVWKEGDPLFDIGMYLFHSLRGEYPSEYAQEFISGYFGKDVSELEKLTVIFYTLFIGMRAVGYFAKFRPDYLPTAISNLRLSSKFVESEQILK